MHREFVVQPDGKFRLEDHDPSFTGEFEDEQQASEKLASDIKEMAGYQDKLYADQRFAVLIILQAMDAAGKDGTIKHVMSGLNPQGVDVRSFKQPTPEELKHDFLWRAAKVLPERGRIGIFNRSYYEEVIIVRVHPELLEAEQIPEPSEKESIWKARYQEINDFEQHLANNRTVILKFLLNISKREQRRRFLARLDDPEKNWKFSESDLKERAFWDDYMKAIEKTLNNTSTEWAPWYVIPADHKWFARAAVAGLIVRKLKSLDLAYPKMSKDQLQRLEEAKEALEAEPDLDGQIKAPE
jgi:PPK2 family polyphosphate:nucleotide phosphotransferase